MQPVDARLLALRDWLPGQVLTGTGGADRKSYRELKFYKRRKRWLS